MRTLPAGFISLIKSELPDALAGPLLETLSSDSAATPAIRLNLRKGIAPGPGLGENIPLGGPNCFYVKGERPVFAYDPAWHAGAYYVQDASSMAMTAAVHDTLPLVETDGKPIKFLDACAAPGGKSIAALDALPDGSFVLANEFDFRRAEILSENLLRRGYPRMVVSRGDTSRLSRLRDMFDIVAVDAPCSGEGMMRKEAEAVNQWSEGLVETCADTQRQILENVWPALKPGGILIYSTCTFNTSENEGQIQWLKDNFGAETLHIPSLDVATEVASIREVCYRFLPGRVDGEGLFIAALRKPSGSPASTSKKKSKDTLPKPKTSPLLVQAQALAQSALDGVFAVVSTDKADGNDCFMAIPAEDGFPAFAAACREALDVRVCGIPLGYAKGRDLIPAWGLALSAALQVSAFPTVELSVGDAIGFLHGDILSSLPDGLPRGFVLAYHCGLPLGFAKNIGPRANNLIPAPLRLRTLPAESQKNTVPLCLNKSVSNKI